MAKDEHVAVLGRGVVAWNAWRAENDEAPDLSRAGLRGLDLSGFDLSRVDLRDVDLRGTKLSGASRSESDARWRRSCRGFSEWSSILELRSAHRYPELAVGLQG